MMSRDVVICLAPFYFSSPADGSITCNPNGKPGLVLCRHRPYSQSRKIRFSPLVTVNVCLDDVQREATSREAARKRAEAVQRERDRDRLRQDKVL